MFSSRFMPCPECGESVERSAVDHQCSGDRLVEYQMFMLRKEVADFPNQLQAYLDSPRGQFEAYVAARDLRQAS